MRQAADNITFFQNTVDSLSLDNDLIKIRSKGITDRPLREVEEETKRLIKYFNIFGLTALVIIFGFFRYYRRKNLVKKDF